MIRIREAGPQDVRRVFDLSNDPVIRQASFSTKAIEWPEHQAWYAEIIKRPEVVFLLGFADEAMEGEFVGQIRYRLESSENAEISISLHSDFRGKGVGGDFLAASLGYLRQHSGVRYVLAQVKESNQASCRFFIKCGFHTTGRLVAEIDGCVTMQYTIGL